MRGSRTNQKGGRRVARGPIIIADGEARANHHRVDLRRRVATAGLLVILIPGKGVGAVSKRAFSRRSPFPRSQFAQEGMEVA